MDIQENGENNQQPDKKKKRRGKKGSIRKRARKTNQASCNRKGGDIGSIQEKQANNNNNVVSEVDEYLAGQRIQDKYIQKYRERAQKIYKITNSSVIVRLWPNGTITERNINSSGRTHKQKTSTNNRNMTRTINIISSTPLLTTDGQPVGDELFKDRDSSPDSIGKKRSRSFLSRCFCCCIDSCP